jgi:hypothetical protein
VIQEDTSGIEAGIMKRMEITQKGLWSKTRIIRVAIPV